MKVVLDVSVHLHFVNAVGCVVYSDTDSGNRSGCSYKSDCFTDTGACVIRQATLEGVE